MLTFPEIDPVIFSLGPAKVRWYGLMYVLGFIASYYLVLHQIKKKKHTDLETHFENINFMLILCLILGGRLGYVFFYNFSYYLNHPAEILATWQGGMSFHGGILGVTVAGYLFTRRHKLDFLKVADVVACVSPIGLFFGRIANFINGELFGRPTDVAWAMVFPRGGPDPRHPSQLYEACLEGFLLFLILHLLWRVEVIRMKPGILTGVFLMGYAFSRMTVEFFREPDGIVGIFTIGQFLSIPMVILGLFLVWRGRQVAAP